VTDLEILKQLYKELQDEDSPPSHPALLALYAKLLNMVPEEGLDLRIICRNLSQTEEWALTMLDVRKIVERRK